MYFSKDRSRKTKKSKQIKKVQKNKITKNKTMKLNNTRKDKHDKKSRKSYQAKNINKTNHYTGGNPLFDTSFLACYDKNLIKVQSAINEYSGKHRIDMTLGEEFINKQISPVRKQAAKDLIENTIYITLKEVSDIVEQLIQKLYRENDLNSANNIYIYSGKPEKSFYFISVLALFYIRKHNLKEPLHFISELSNDLFDTIGSDPVILFDDVAYSGTQLSNMLGNIYFNRVVKNNKPIPNILVGLIALNHFSKVNISRVPIKKTRSGAVLEYQASPFKLVFLQERLYTPLIINIGIERYFYLNLFFTPYTESTPYISLYLDHKIADEASTYKNALLYGPIVPSNYDYGHFFTTIDYLFDFIPSKNLFGLEPEQVDKLYEDFNKDNNTAFKHSLDVNQYLIQKLKSIDTQEREILHNSFVPFINGCNSSAKLLENINDPDIINFDYVMFVAPDGCIAKNNDCTVTNDGILWYFDEYFDNQKTNLTKEDVIRISNKVNRYRCPDSWYKKGEFKMNCISE